MSVLPTLKELGAAALITGCFATFMAQLPSRQEVTRAAEPPVCGMPFHQLQQARFDGGAEGVLIPRVWASFATSLQSEELQNTCTVVSMMMAAQGDDKIGAQLVATELMVAQSCDVAGRDRRALEATAELFGVSPAMLQNTLCKTESSHAPSPSFGPTI